MAFKYYGQSLKGITPDMEQNEDKQHSAPKVKELTLSEELGKAMVGIYYGIVAYGFIAGDVHSNSCLCWSSVYEASQTG